MKGLAVILLALVAAVASKSINPENVLDLEQNIAFGYHSKFGIPLANEIRTAEAQAQSSRIAGGSVTQLGEVPYHVGLIIDLTNGQQSVCGGAILTNWRVVTTAHCWNDGRLQGFRVTVIAGSLTLFSGGQRLQSSSVAMHGNWNPSLYRDDIAIININSALSFSNIVSAVALPSANEVNSDFNGFTGTVSGFGRTSDSTGITQTQVLSHVDVPVITNTECLNTFWNVIASHICTRNTNRQGPCPGDTGGPLTVISNNRRVLVGVYSFGSGLGCTFGFPAVYVRVTSYIDWINARL